MTAKGLYWISLLWQYWTRTMTFINNLPPNFVLNRCNYKVKSNKGKIYHELDVVLKLKFVVVAFEPISPKISPCWFESDIYLRPDSSDIPESLAVWRMFRLPVPSQDQACGPLHWCSCHRPGQTGWVSHLHRWEEPTLVITCASAKLLFSNVCSETSENEAWQENEGCQSVATNDFILGQVISRAYGQNWSAMCKDSSVEPGSVY